MPTEPFGTLFHRGTYNLMTCIPQLKLNGFFRCVTFVTSSRLILCLFDFFYISILLHTFSLRWTSKSRLKMKFSVLAEIHFAAICWKRFKTDWKIIEFNVNLNEVHIATRPIFRSSSLSLPQKLFLFYVFFFFFFFFHFFLWCIENHLIAWNIYTFIYIYKDLKKSNALFIPFSNRKRCRKINV